MYKGIRKCVRLYNYYKKHYDIYYAVVLAYNFRRAEFTLFYFATEEEYSYYKDSEEMYPFLEDIGQGMELFNIPITVKNVKNYMAETGML